jgi:hypothetical protein
MATSSDAKKAVLLFRNLDDAYAASSMASTALVLISADRNQAKRFVCSQNIFLTQYREEPSSENPQSTPEGVRAPAYIPEIVNGTIAINSTDPKISAVSTIPSTQTHNEFIAYNARGHRVGLWLIQSTKRPKGTVIVLRGGPADTVFDRNVGQLEHLALREGYRLLWVDYSGSENTAFDVGVRLGQDRNQAIKRDADAVLAFIKHRRFDQNQPVLLLAESFGSGLAAQLMRQDSTKIKKAILAVPAGTWVRPDARQETGQSERGQRGQAVYNRLVLGAPFDQVGNPSDPWFKAIRETICNDPRSVLIFGENDKVVQASDWNPECADHPNLHVLAKGNHQVGSHPRALEIFQAQLDAFK